MTVSLVNMTKMFQFAHMKREVGKLLLDAEKYINHNQPKGGSLGILFRWSDLSVAQKGTLNAKQFRDDVTDRAEGNTAAGKPAVPPSLWLEGAAASATACRPLYPSRTYASNDQSSVLYPLPLDPIALLIYQWNKIPESEYPLRIEILHALKKDTEFAKKAGETVVGEISRYLDEIISAI